MTSSEYAAGKGSRCPTCNVGTLRPQTITDAFEYEVDGETTSVVAENVPVLVCDNLACGEKLSGPEAVRIRHEAICHAFRLLAPEAIQTLRERVGPTQEEFARLTGIGTATLSRWERGRLLQNRAMDNYLRLVDRSEENTRFLRDLNVNGLAEPERIMKRMGNDCETNGGRELNFHDTLEGYKLSFMGFGNPAGKYWFVGIEQGGSDDQIKDRLRTWHERGRRPIEDLHEYHLAIGQSHWTGKNPDPQPTWSFLIRTVLVAENGRTPTEAEILSYQRRELGRSNGETCLLDLFPMPCEGVKDWSYPEWTGLPRSKRKYRRRIGPARVQSLRDLIDNHHPPIVVFYGTTFREWWQQVVDGEQFCTTRVSDIEKGTRGATVCILLPHPNKRGINPAHLFSEAGRLIRTILNPDAELQQGQDPSLEKPVSAAHELSFTQKS